MLLKECRVSDTPANVTPMNQLIHWLLTLTVCLLAILAGWAIVSSRSDTAAGWVRHTLEVLSVESDLLSACQDASSSSRGYLLSGAKDFKNTYDSATKNIDTLTLEIQKLTADNPSQQVLLQRFKEQTAQLRRLSERMYVKSPVTRSNDIQKLVNDQKESMDHVKRTLQDIRDEEKRLLDQRNKESQINEQLVWCTFGVLAAVSFGVLAVVVKAGKENTKRVKDHILMTEKAAQQERLLASVVRAVKDYAIFMLDPAGNIITWNQGAERLNGYSSEEAIGKNFNMFYPPDVVAAGHPKYELVAALKEGRYEEEGWRIRKDGSRFWANVIITAIYDQEGKHTGFAKVTRDLTEQKRVERALTEARDKAVAADEAKSRFLSTVSHEVRTPMAGVIGLVELIALEAQKDDNVRHLADTALLSCKRLLHILNDLLDASKLQAGALKIEHRRFYIRPVIGDLVQLASPEATKKNLDISCAVAANVPEMICGDELRVRQILQNLTFNAIKFTPSGKIMLRVELANSDNDTTTLKFTVSDTGIGIALDEQERLFEPFEQLSNSTARVFGGTGLGLSISRTLVSLMNGEIGVESEPGVGSTFWVVIPFRDALCQA